MPTIKTVGTGKDYTTWASWETFAGGQANADQYGEGYSGSNLASVLVNTWTATPTASVYPRMYVASGEGHGLMSGAGAYISNSAGGVNGIYANVSYLRIEGLRLFADSSGDGIQAAASNIRIDSCLIEVGSSGSAIGQCVQGNSTTITVNTHGTRIAIGQCFQGGYYYNCSARFAGTTSFGSNYGFFSAAQVKNCMAFDFNTYGGACFNAITTQEYNISSDTTATGTGSQTSKSASDQWTNVSSDWSLKTGADAIDGGTDVSASSGSSVDALGTARGATWDVGPYEFAAAGLGIPIAAYHYNHHLGSMN